MNIIDGHVQIYNIWTNGRSIDDNAQQFPISYDVWHNDFKKAVKDYFAIKIKDSDSEDGFYSEIFDDYYVALYSIDINIADFEKMFDIKFDLENEDVQDFIPYYVNYDFNTVAERIAKFK